MRPKDYRDVIYSGHSKRRKEYTDKGWNSNIKHTVIKNGDIDDTQGNETVMRRHAKTKGHSGGPHISRGFKQHVLNYHVGKSPACMMAKFKHMLARYKSIFRAYLIPYADYVDIKIDGGQPVRVSYNGNTYPVYHHYLKDGLICAPARRQRKAKSHKKTSMIDGDTTIYSEDGVLFKTVEQTFISYSSSFKTYWHTLSSREITDQHAKTLLSNKKEFQFIPRSSMTICDCYGYSWQDNIFYKVHVKFKKTLNKKEKAMCLEIAQERNVDLSQ